MTEALTILAAIALFAAFVWAQISADRAREYRAQHFARAKVMLRLFEVKRQEREVVE